MASEFSSTETIIDVRTLKIEDYTDFAEAMSLAYEKIGGHPWTYDQIELLLKRFPEGQVCVTVNGKLVASALALVIDYEKFGDNHTYKQITGNGSFNTHDDEGDVLYGIDIFVHPDYRNLRLARRLYDARKEVCETLNLRAIVAGGRIPYYGKVADKYTPKEYINLVQSKDLYDPILTFQLSNGFHVKKVLRNYLTIDTQSRQYATLIEWNNIYYEDNEKLFNQRKSVIRLGLVQWQMRLYDSFNDLMNQAEFFVDAVSGYKADFVLFPEFFATPLMAEYNHMPEEVAIRHLAQFTPQIRDKFAELAVSYNINIITGSLPFRDDEDEHLYNISYLCRRDGSTDSYRKIHITPSESLSWGMVGGDDLRVYDTDCGKIGIQICYDVEFPELTRIQAEQGLSILFVPFLTDTQNGYNRVRRCAQARAVENEIYVAIAGCVGNLPKVNNMDIQYAQSAVFSPSDFQFPTTAVIAEATPNTEMTLICDVDLDLLKELHHKGSVRNLKDRRKDLYELKLKKT